MAKEPVTARISPAVKRTLEHEAGRLGRTLSEHVEQSLTAAVSGDRAKATEQRVEALERKVDALHGDLFRVLRSVLIATGFSRAEAEETVEQVRGIHASPGRPPMA